MKYSLLTSLMLSTAIIAVSCGGGDIPLPPAAITVKEPPIDRTWINPGKVEVKNYYPGARAEWEMAIHNGSDEIAEFSISYREPNYTTKDFTTPPLEAQNWIIIADTTPVLMPLETRTVLVTIEMPEEADAPDKWEFWISVIDMTRSDNVKMGNVKTELCTRWLVNMR